MIDRQNLFGKIGAMIVDTHKNIGLKSAHRKPNSRGYTVRRLIIDRLQGRFEVLINKYLEKEGISKGDLARIVGIQQTHLSLLLHRKRPLSGYYLFQFIRSGIFKVADIYDNKPESEREADFWRMASEAENISLLNRIAKIRAKGVDVNGLLDMIDPPEKDS